MVSKNACELLVPAACRLLLSSQVPSHSVYRESLQHPAAKEDSSVPERNIPRQAGPVVCRHRRDQAAAKPSKSERQNPSEGKEFKEQ